MALYSEKVIEHFQNPHNYGKIDKASGIGAVGNMRCGDLMKLYIKVNKDEVIKSLYKQVCVLQKHVIKQDRKLKFFCDRVVELECKSGHDDCAQEEPNEYHAQNFEAMLHLFNKKFNKLDTSLN